MGAGLALRSVSAFVIALFPPARALAQAAHISTGVTEEALHQSPVLFRHQTSQRQHHPEAGTLYPSAPSQPGKAFTKVTGSQAIWSHGLANIPSPTSFLLPHPAVATLPCCFQGPQTLWEHGLCTVRPYDEMLFSQDDRGIWVGWGGDGS